MTQADQGRVASEIMAFLRAVDAARDLPVDDFRDVVRTEMRKLSQRAFEILGKALEESP